MINITLIQESLPILLKGLTVSLQIAGLASLIGFTLGTILAIAHTSKIKLFSLLVSLFVTIIRGTPMLIQILFAFYLLPQLGISIDAFWTAVIAIGLNSSAYISQIIKAGIASISTGQKEAAQVLGLSKLQTMYYIVLPQAITAIFPALGNEFITLIKDSSLASIIGVAELSKEGSVIRSRTYDAISVFVVVALLYLVVTTLASFIILRLERWMRHHA